MSKKQLSNEFISDSESEDEDVFTPPRHYHELKSSKTGFKPSSDKEVWLFRLPKSLNLKDISSLPITAESNQAVFTQNNITYKITQEMFLQDLTTQKYTIIAPLKHNNFKTSKNSNIKRIFTIFELVAIPDINMAKVNVPRQDVPKEENLRMRHFPTGYSAKDYKELAIVDVPSKKRSGAELLISGLELDEKKLKKDKKEKKDKKDKKDKKKDKKSKKD